ncbi:hypothetical protein ACRALDRAFT_206171 [Sodiomyces alcalophilus JCM 7366]|uniref:uncharacterized protein n=1 Tax=Sodiomyces alcalophilus JCM 7366 TaxID=591952 RepID=UPI0039B4EE95
MKTICQQSFRYQGGFLNPLNTWFGLTVPFPLSPSSLHRVLYAFKAVGRHFTQAIFKGFDTGTKIAEIKSGALWAEGSTAEKNLSVSVNPLAARASRGLQGQFSWLQLPRGDSFLAGHRPQYDGMRCSEAEGCRRSSVDHAKTQFSSAFGGPRWVLGGEWWSMYSITIITNERVNNAPQNYMVGSHRPIITFALHSKQQDLHDFHQAQFLCLATAENPGRNNIQQRYENPAHISALFVLCVKKGSPRSEWGYVERFTFMGRSQSIVFNGGLRSPETHTKLHARPFAHRETMSLSRRDHLFISEHILSDTVSGQKDEKNVQTVKQTASWTSAALRPHLEARRGKSGDRERADPVLEPLKFRVQKTECQSADVGVLAGAITHCFDIAVDLAHHLINLSPAIKENKDTMRMLEEQSREAARQSRKCQELGAPLQRKTSEARANCNIMMN